MLREQVGGVALKAQSNFLVFLEPDEKGGGQHDDSTSYPRNQSL
jgi:hypothetical protein